MLLYSHMDSYRDFPGVSVVKNSPTKQETQFQSLGREDLLEKEMVIHSSILAWENPMDRGAWQAIDHGVTRAKHDFVTKQHSRLVILHIMSFFHGHITDIKQKLLI